MKPKIEGTNSNTNTVQVELDNITVCGTQPVFPKMMFSIGKYCKVKAD